MHITLNQINEMEACGDGLEYFTVNYPNGLELPDTGIIEIKSDMNAYLEWLCKTLGRDYKIRSSDGSWRTKEYNAAGHETRFENNNGYWQTKEYNAAGELITFSTNKGIPTDLIVFS